MDVNTFLDKVAMGAVQCDVLVAHPSPSYEHWWCVDGRSCRVGTSSEASPLPGLDQADDGNDQPCDGGSASDR